MLNVSFNRCAQPGFTCTLLDIKEPQQPPGVPAAVLTTTGISVPGMSSGGAAFCGVMYCSCTMLSRVPAHGLGMQPPPLPLGKHGGDIC